jgi:hypothetical protein
MSRTLFFFSLLAFCWSAGTAQPMSGKNANAAYVNALYAKYQAEPLKTIDKSYPAFPANTCPDCYVWINPYYRSIADVKKHIPIITYEYYRKADAAIVGTFGLKREGIYADWHNVTGDNEDGVYAAANKATRAQDPKAVIAKGHCEPWILNAFCYDAAILSDTYTFNAAPENQKQNVGTEIATENKTRELLKSMNVEVWCGTAGSQGAFTEGPVTVTYPAFYWKIIKAGSETTCYWMPNNAAGTQATLNDCIKPYQELVANLGFDPEKVFLPK